MPDNGSNFYITASTGRRLSDCKRCHNKACAKRDPEKRKAIAKEWKENHRDTVSAWNRRDSKKHNAARRAWLWEFKSKAGCIECGFNHNPVALQFHHVSNKTMDVSKMLGKSLDAIKEEVKKCVVLCANCHAIHHHNERAHSSPPLPSGPGKEST